MTQRIGRHIEMSESRVRPIDHRAIEVKRVVPWPRSATFHTERQSFSPHRGLRENDLSPRERHWHQQIRIRSNLSAVDHLKREFTQVQAHPVDACRQAAASGTFCCFDNQFDRETGADRLLRSWKGLSGLGSVPRRTESFSLAALRTAILSYTCPRTFAQPV